MAIKAEMSLIMRSPQNCGRVYCDDQPFSERVQLPAEPEASEDPAVGSGGQVEVGHVNLGHVRGIDTRSGLVVAEAYLLQFPLPGHRLHGVEGLSLGVLTSQHALLE